MGKSHAAIRLCELLPRTVIAGGVTTQPIPEDANDAHVSRPAFGRLLGEDKLCMVMELWGHYYGYLRAPLEEALSEGQTVVLPLLFARDVREAMRLHDTCERIHLRPAQWELIEERLSSRCGLSTADLLRLIASNRDVLRELDLLNWSLVVDVRRDSDQAQEIADYLVACE